MQARILRLLAIAFALFAAASLYAQATPNPREFSIPAQPLASALIEYSRQSGVQVLTSGANIGAARSPGVNGRLSPTAALDRLLDGTGFAPEFIDTGTVAVAPRGAAAAVAAQADTLPTPQPAQTTASATLQLHAVKVTGSRIPRAQLEGPAPIVAITADEIRDNGFGSAYEIMTALTQNLGSVENNTNTNGFSPGAIGVDLRGLGPNHTLVLINGRRIADYPQSYLGDSNFTDISNIPVSLIDRVEILSGSASAVYGSDAISGVINFILKQKANGTTLNLRIGDTQHGGAETHRLQFSSGWSSERVDAVVGLEFYHQAPLWGFQRDYTDSRLDSPVPTYASPVFARIDANGNYIDPGAATCAALSSLDHGSVFYAYRPNVGHYCGSNQDVGYGTLTNGRKMANLFASVSWHLRPDLDFFVDLLAGTSHQESYNTPLQWQNSEPLNGDSAPVPFYNLATGRIEQWQRRYFTIEENGGFEAGKIRNIGNTYSVNTGLKGTLPGTDWSFEALFGHAQNRLKSKWPALVSAEAQAFYLGPSLGIDPASGYRIYDAPISRLYTPLTVAQFRSITRDSIDRDFSRAENFSATLTNPELLQLPSGPAGFAAVAEYGNQYYGLKPDPLSLDGSYYGLHNTGAVGSRDHAGIGAEFKVPLLRGLDLSSAARYDRYNYAATSSGRFTWSLGLEYRPVESLLLRGSLSTGFRAPDLAFLFAGASGSSSSGIDYYLCGKLQPTVPLGSCSYNYVSFNGRSHGSTDLRNETSTSLTWGFVYSPWHGFDLSADYYRIRLKNEVLYESSDMILRQEAQCRLGGLDPNSALCRQVISQVVRNPASDRASPEQITSVLVLPINAAADRTSGIDVKAHYRIETDRAGRFDFDLAYTYVATHTLQQFPGDEPIDELHDLYDYVIPRDKASYSAAWARGRFTATLYGYRLGGLPDWAGTRRLSPTFVYNASLNFRYSPATTFTLLVDNLFDSPPRRSGDWSYYPYYPNRWFSPLGRQILLEVDHRFGGVD
ncbi:MAG: TonB-dependent receptor [Rudaea sp.]|uniref:TonB-dependent receptor n=1 Tax=unclassified Rudaea TaxID=2627037 RepID=UPI0014850716|nr:MULTISPECIES: TonB-dependent receptor [unclassified Rudaea]MBN8888395.1 TonB-dependent receptor [Rudaea sp.]